MAGTRRLPRTVARQVGGKPRDALLEPKVTRLSLGAAEKEQRCAATALGIDAIEALAAEGAGGRFSLELSSRGKRFHIYGSVVAATPGRGLTLRWSWDTDSPVLGSARDTGVTVEFVPARGVVDVVITHEALPSEAVRDAYIRGWRRCLDGMVRVTGSAPPKDVR